MTYNSCLAGIDEIGGGPEPPVIPSPASSCVHSAAALSRFNRHDSSRGTSANQKFERRCHRVVPKMPLPLAIYRCAQYLAEIFALPTDTASALAELAFGEVRQ